MSVLAKDQGESGQQWSRRAQGATAPWLAPLWLFFRPCTEVNALIQIILCISSKKFWINNIMHI
jgi:hypothetical protein